MTRANVVLKTFSISPVSTWTHDPSLVVRPHVVKHELPVLPELSDALVISNSDTFADGRDGDRLRDEVILMIVLITSFEYPDSEKKLTYTLLFGSSHNVSVHRCPRGREPPCEPH